MRLLVAIGIVLVVYAIFGFVGVCIAALVLLILFIIGG
jgi:hypothetical protein